MVVVRGIQSATGQLGSECEQLPHLDVDDEVMPMLGGAILAGALFLGACGLAAQYGLRLLIRYQLCERELRVRFVGLKVVEVPYEEIQDVRMVRFGQVLVPRTTAVFNAIKAGNRLFFRDAVLVRRAAGLRKFVIMTPDDASGFAEELRTRASRAKQAPLQV
jgi:hypothetical protein